MLSKYDRLAGQVDSLLSQVSDVEVEKLSEVSAEYTAAVSEINERLRKAVALLHKGLRDEAIQECERVPNLLDAFEALDIHEQELWRSMHRTLRVPLPPPLLLQQAAELNGAYALQVPLTDLLRKHRLLALGHAPLEHRIQILRQIAKKDPTSEVWHTDIKAYETERIAEIKTVVSRIRQTRDLAAIQALYREVHSDERIVPVPDDLKTQIVELLHELEIAAARKKLTQISRDLLATFSEFDTERGFELQHTWDLYLGPAKLAPDDDIIAETQPALDWLAEKRREMQQAEERDSMLARLEMLLDDEESDRNELESTFNRLSSSGTEISTVMVRRFRNRMNAIQTRERRLHSLKLIGIVGAIAICGGAVITGLRGLQHATRVHEAASLLSSLRADRQWQQGLGLIESNQQNAPYVFKSTSFQNEKNRFELELQNDQSRISDFRKLDADIQIGGVTIEDATKISKMSSVAITDEEKQHVAELKRQMEVHDAEREAQAKVAFNEAIGEVDELFQTNPDPTETQLSEWLAKIEKARKSHPYALRDRQGSLGVADHDQILENKLKQKLNDRRLEQQLARKKQSIDANVGRSLSVHIARLKELASALGDSEAGKDLSKTLEEESLWLAQLKFNKVLASLPAKIEMIDVKEANGAVKKLQTASQTRGTPNSLAGLERHLAAVGKRPTLLQVSRLVPEPIRKPENASLTEELLKIYQDMGKDLTQWEKGFRDAFDAILANSTVDPILRLQLYEVALNRATGGSHAYEMGFEKVSKQFSAPKKEEILRAKSNEDAEIFLTKLPHKEAKRQHVFSVRELRKTASHAKWVGWISLNQDNRIDGPLMCWIVPSVPNGRLFFVVEEDGKLRHQHFGRVANNEVLLDEVSLLKLGRPVFWMK